MTVHRTTTHSIATTVYTSWLQHRLQKLALTGTIHNKIATFRLNSAATLHLHSFSCWPFHVLFNSLFRVLFNFPSRYLLAIGLTVSVLEAEKHRVINVAPLSLSTKEAFTLGPIPVLPCSLAVTGEITNLVSFLRLNQAGTVA